MTHERVDVDAVEAGQVITFPESRAMSCQKWVHARKGVVIAMVPNCKGK